MMKAASKIKEDHACFPPPYTSNDVHGAVIDPAPRNTPTYSWKKCGNCTFIGTTSEAGVTYGATSATKPSESRNDQELTVTAVVKGDDGQTASATCTTNFTVVAVNVSVGGAGEDGEETAPQNVMYSRELTKFAIANMTPVKVTCEPKSLPETELVWLMLPDNVELFELSNDGTAKSAKSYCRCNEIGGKSFGLLGRPPSGNVVEDLLSWDENGYVKVDHYSSEAKVAYMLSSDAAEIEGENTFR